MSPFTQLGLPASLLLSDDDIKKAFQQKSREAHPDHGGNVEAFAALNEAHQILFVPASRLKAWMLVNQISIDERGAIASELIDIFSEIAALLANADALIMKREQATSQLSKALLEKEVFLMRNKIEAQIDFVSLKREEHVKSTFSQIENSNSPDLANSTLRSLIFIEKWIRQLRERFGRLW